jgi:hypothetical protein
MRAQFRIPASAARIEFLSSLEFEREKRQDVTGANMSDSVQYFEGVEKLLEIWFTTGDSSNKAADLRKIPRAKLESLLKIVRCEIISFMKNEQVDAYVLR